MDMTTLLNEAVKNGIWALLFVVLFIWTIRENKTRETAYQETIKQVNDSILSKVCSTAKTVDELDNKVTEVDEKIDNLDKKVDVLSIKVDGLNNRI